MKMFKKMIKLLLLVTIGPVLLYMALALVLSYISFSPKQIDCQDAHRFFVSSNGVHTDIILPTAIVDPVMKPQLGIEQGTAFVAFGWGDKGFYLDTPTWAELKASTAAKAMLMNSPTAMHVTNYFQVKPDWKEAKICDEQLTAIYQHIRESFSYDKEGNIMEIVGKGYTPHDRFYEAEGNYTGIYTCNVWVNQGLKKAHIRTSVWSPFEFGIMHYMEKVNLETVR